MGWTMRIRSETGRKVGERADGCKWRRTDWGLPAFAGTGVKALYSPAEVWDTPCAKPGVNSAKLRLQFVHVRGNGSLPQSLGEKTVEQFFR